MSYAVEIEKPRVEKHSLVILRPRYRVTGWALDSGNVWVAEFDRGWVSRLWARYDGTDGFTRVDAMPTNDREFWYDEENGLLYVQFDDATTGPDDLSDTGYQDAYGPTVAGITAEYELYLSTSTFSGPRDPLDNTADVVDWLPVLRESPQATGGDRTTLYGFNPLNESTLQIMNQDGWMLPHLYDSSFNMAAISSYVMADRSLERAVLYSNVREVFRGYAGNPKLTTEGMVALPCFDFFAVLDRPANPAAQYSLAEFPNVDPSAIVPGKEWWIRRVRGLVDNFQPVNIDYNATVTTSNNRDFATHEGTGTEGSIAKTVDHLAANTNTRTYFTTPNVYNVHDCLIIERNGVDKYVIVTAIGSNYVDHLNIGSTVAPGDLVTRFYIGWVKVRDSDGNWWNLFAGRNFTPINKATLGNDPDWLGFRLIDDWEADIGFPETFDPSKHTILCRVYGTDVLDKYADNTTDVGETTEYGGVAAQAITILHYLLRQAGIPNAMIDQSTFELAETNHSLGLAIPRDRESLQAGSYRDLIGQVLKSVMWKLTYVDISGAIGIGLLETAPFVSDADQEVDDVDFNGFYFEVDYADVYDSVAMQYGHKEVNRTGDYEIFYSADHAQSVADGTLSVIARNYLARDLHQVQGQYELDGLQYIEAEAQLMANRYAFALGDRRAFYTLTLGPEWMNKVNLGSSFQVKRKQLPGFPISVDTDSERQTMLIEATKSPSGIIITTEDQKGIQDNSGDWT